MIVQHVLVPIDFSTTADQALAYAIALAQQLQARLTLLHVLDLPPVAMGEMTPGVAATYLEAQETDAQHLLQASLERVQHAGLQGASLLVEGDTDAKDCGDGGRAGGRPDYHGDAWAHRARPRVVGQCG
jgi:nucleotide-binding universal stress UspA family protein